MRPASFLCNLRTVLGIKIKPNFFSPLRKHPMSSEVDLEVLRKPSGRAFMQELDSAPQCLKIR
jgi:hypothetical protein